MKKNYLLILSIFLFQTVYTQNALLIPDTINDTNINLALDYGTYEFFTGKVTNTMGANGNILGPTLILQQGDSINISVANQLSDTTTIHWHGMHVSAENDGGPHTVIPPATVWKPAFTVRDKAALYWYHPHLHEKTDLHVSKGIAGLIIVRDNEEAQLDLPRTYGVDDIPLVIQTKAFDADYQILAHSNSDSVVMVNATINPYVDLPAQVVRLRILNGSSQRVFNLGLSNNETFLQIASDGGLFSGPFETNRLQIAPGERAEILLNLNSRENDTVYLMSYASELPNGIYGATYPGTNTGMVLNAYNPNPMNGADFNILQINVKVSTTNPVTSIPTSLVSVNPIDESLANTTRTLTFSPETMGLDQLNGKFLINDASFDMDVINYTIPFENIEIWELTNRSAIAHPFHIHDVQFYILSRNGNVPPVNEQGRKDVVLVKAQETVRFITKFETFADDKVPYMYHCHMLPHEDAGMMGQFVVSSNPLSVESYNLNKPEVKIITTQNKGEIKIIAEEKISDIRIYNLQGKSVFPNIEYDINTALVKNLSPGISIVMLSINNQLVAKKVIIY
ncbi:MAG: multicopper oxidase domain-containing protein [Bacteroidales bacterium]|nr:multicopper oxidase domain-containing protein [Bacteroidales bacterium]